MLVRRIRLENFMVHDRAELVLPKTGVTLITGPNGSGKSSWIEAMGSIWNRCVRNKKSRRTRGFRKQQAGTVTIDAGAMEIVRTAKAGGSLDLAFTVDGDGDTYATTSKAQDALESHVGDFDMWRRSHVFTSKEAALFTSATDKGRRELLEEMLQSDELAKAHTVALIRRRLLEAKVGMLTNQYDEECTAMERADEEEEAAQKNLDEMKPVEALEPVDLDALRTEYYGHNARMHRLQRELAASYEYENAESAIVTARINLEALSAPKAPAEVDMEELRSIIKCNTAIVQVGEKELSTIGDNAIPLRQTFERAKVQLEEAQVRQRRLDQDECPTCAQPIGVELKSTLSAGVESRQQTVKEMDDNLRELEQMHMEERADLREETAELRSQLEAARTAKAKADAEHQAFLEAATRYRDDWGTFSAKLHAIEDAVKDWVPSRDRLEIETQIAETSTARELAKVERVQATERLSAYNRAESEYKRNKARWDALVTDRNKAAEALQCECDTMWANLLQAKRDLAIALAGEKMLGPKGIRAHLLGNALAAVETVANRWLREFHDTIRVQLSSYTESGKTAISLVVAGRESGADYEDLSSGEQRVVDLAMVFALAETARLARGVTEWGTLFLDEILDALDENVADRVCAAIQRLSDDRPVLVITHVSAVRDRLQPVQEVEHGFDGVAI